MILFFSLNVTFDSVRVRISSAGFLPLVTVVSAALRELLDLASVFLSRRSCVFAVLRGRGGLLRGHVAVFSVVDASDQRRAARPLRCLGGALRAFLGGAGAWRGLRRRLRRRRLSRVRRRRDALAGRRRAPPPPPPPSPASSSAKLTKFGSASLNAFSTLSFGTPRMLRDRLRHLGDVLLEEAAAASCSLCALRARPQVRRRASARTPGSRASSRAAARRSGRPPPSPRS